MSENIILKVEHSIFGEWVPALNMSFDTIEDIGIKLAKLKHAGKLPESEDIEFGLTVPVNFYLPYYEAKLESKCVKKTLTIPENLNRLAEECGINFSQLLADALAEKLGV